ncbi:MAG: hypothetical protein JWN93_1839 [Hyphomicrobiales bacterium]|nr:hypothetical protein [Hyphomicrobiales bacterium]
MTTQAPADAYEADRSRIRELIQNWALWRDMGEWAGMRSVWHDDGRMQATWKQGGADEFVQATIDAWDKGVTILHMLGGTTVEVRGERAVSITKVTVTQRALAEGVECDVICMARHYDFWEKRSGRWGLVLREGIYDKDWIAPVEPGARIALDPGLLAQFPPEYRHLAYLQTKAGFPVKRDMPCLKGPAVEALYARGAGWLGGAPTAWAREPAG